MANLSLFARLGLDTKAFSQGINSAQKKAGGFKNMLGGLGAQLTALASVGGLVLASRRAVQLGRDMEQLANRTNTTVEAFMSLRAAAVDSGSSQQTLERALRNVNARTVEATRGNKAYAEAIEELGLNVDEFAAMSVEQRFEAIAKSVANADDEMRALAIASRILGERAGPELLKTMRQVGSEGLDPLVAKMKASGRVMGQDTVKALENLDTNLGALRERFTIFVAVLIARVTPAILGIIDKVNGLFSASKHAIRIIGTFTAAMLLSSRIAGTFAMAVRGLAVAKGVFTSATLASANALNLFKVALAKTGIGLIVVALGEAAYWMYRFFTRGKEAADGMEDLGNKTKKAGDDISKVFDDLEDAGSKVGKAGSEGLEKITRSAYDTRKAIEQLYQDWYAAEQEFERKRKQEEEEAFLRTKELEALRARASGDDALAKTLEEAVKKTREALQMQERYNIELEEAAQLIGAIEGQAERSAIRAAAATSEGLQTAANVAGRSAGATFEPMRDGNFQRYINGQEAGVFSDAELQAAIREKLADDASEKLLGDIVEALKGRFVNE